MGNRKFNDEIAGHLAEEYKEGKTLAELADAYEATIPTVRNTLLREGVILRARGRRPGRDASTAVTITPIVVTGSVHQEAVLVDEVDPVETGNTEDTGLPDEDEGLPLAAGEDTEAGEGSHDALERFKRTIVGINSDPVLQQYRS